MVTTQPAVAVRPRSFVRVAGPDAADYLQRMVSNDVEALAAGEACDALLLTPKARVIAPLVVLRRGHDDFLLLTEPELGEAVRDHLMRMRLRARVEVALEEHTSVVVIGGGDGISVSDYGEPAVEVLDADIQPTIGDEELERLRILARTPRFGREIDDRVLPAEAGLDQRAISFTKGCYPGQEPVARLHYRGRANRGLRVLEIAAEEPPPYDAELLQDGKAVGRVTSAVRDGNRIVALAYVRREVPASAELTVGASRARILEPR